MRGLKWAAALTFVLAAVPVAWAGWEIEQTSYNLRASGKEVARMTVTLLVSKDRVRTSDGKTTTIFDYNEDRVTWMMPSKKIFWSGTSDEYISAASRLNPKQRFTKEQFDKAPKLAVKIEETPQTAEIAGRHTKRYAVNLDGYPFQEIWITDAFGIEKDLNVLKLQAMQIKLAQTMRTSYGIAVTALQKDPLYQQISSQGFPMRTHSYLGEAIVGTEVVKAVQKDIPESEFVVPKDYKRAKLADIKEAQESIKPTPKPQAPSKKPTPSKKAAPKN